MNQRECKVITCSWRNARENAREQVKNGIGFASHWLTKWREFCWPITERSNVKTNALYSRPSAENRSIVTDLSIFSFPCAFVLYHGPATFRA